MAERGCLKDGHFQNLEVENSVMAPVKNSVKLLVDRADAGVIKFNGADATLSVSDSGGIFLVPLLTEHQTIALPAPNNDTVGCSYTFIAVGDQVNPTAIGKTFIIETVLSDAKILATTNAGTGAHDAAMAKKDSVGFTANAIPGTVIKIVGISARAASAWIMIDDKESLHGNTDTISMG